MIEYNEYIYQYKDKNQIGYLFEVKWIYEVRSEREDFNWCRFWAPWTPRIFFWAPCLKSEDLDCFQKRFITFAHHFWTLILLHITNCWPIRHLPFVRSEVNCHIVAALKKVFTVLRDLQIYFSVTSVAELGAKGQLEVNFCRNTEIHWRSKYRGSSISTVSISTDF